MSSQSPLGNSIHGSPEKSPRHGLILAILLGLTLLAYAPGLFNGFINVDDPFYVFKNDHVRGGLTIQNIAWAWTTLHVGFWQPSTWMSLQLDASVYGPDAAWGFHLTNILWHAANVGLLYWWLFRCTGDAGRSALVAGLFGVHPLHVESVAWVTERKDVLSAFFLLLTLLAYKRYVELPGKLRYLAVMGCYLLGLAAKPMLVTLPCVLFLLDFWPLGRFRQGKALTLVLEKVPLLALALGIAFLTIYAHGTNVVSLEKFSMEQRLANVLHSMGWYLEKTVIPTGLSAYYPDENFALLSWPVLTHGAILLGGIVALLVAGKGSPACCVGLLWFAITLLPVSGLIPAGGFVRADRFVYVPHIGLFLAIVWALADLAQRWRVPRGWQIGLACSWLLVLAGMTFRQVQYWRNDLTLWTHALTIQEDNIWAHQELGIFWHRRARAARADPVKAAEFLKNAQDHMEQEFHLNELRQRLYLPNPADSLAMVYFEAGDMDKAAEHLNKLLTRLPNNPWCLLHVGDVLSRQKKFAEAVKHFSKAEELGGRDPNLLGKLAEQYDRLARDLRATGEPDSVLLNEVENALRELQGKSF